MLRANLINKSVLIKIVIVLTVFFNTTGVVEAISKEDREAVNKGTVFFDPNFECDPNAIPGAPIAPGPIYIVGDSVMSYVQNKLTSDLSSRGWTPKINALSSRKLNGTPPSPDGLGAVEADKGFISGAKVIVVALGTNPSSGFEANVPNMINKLRSISPGASIYWVDTAAYKRPSFYPTIAGVNSAIYNQSTALNYKVLSWYKKVYGDNFDPKTVNATANDSKGYINTTDGVYVHPTDNGVNAYSELITSTVAAGIPPVSTPPPNPGTATPVQSLPSVIPAPYSEIFPKAAAQFGTDLALLTTIFWKEHGGSFPPPPPPYGNGNPWRSSPAGAQGPFQFLSGTWAAHGQDGNGDGRKDIQDLTDAAYGSASFLRSMGGVAGTPPGSIDAPVEPNTIVRVMLAYNWGPGNVERAYNSGRRSFNDITSREAKDYITRGMPFYLQIIGNLGLGVGNLVDCKVDGGGTGVSADGFVFPLITSKNQIRTGNGTGFRWCYSNERNCHNNYNAADIGVPTGTPVVAARGGEILTARQTTSNFGATIRIKGDDGFWYYYAHLSSGSLTVRGGDRVTAGQQLGVIGNAEEGEGTVHLHFDISPVENGFGRPSAKASEVLINPQPVLIQAYQGLPE